MMVSIMMTIVLTITPPEKHGSAMGLCACAIQLGPALGPTVSGLILQFFDWHVLFIALIPIVILLMIFGYLYLANVITLTKPKIDFLSILLSTLGVGGVVYGLNGFSGGGSLNITIAVFVVGMIALILFGKRQLSLKQPMLEIRTFRYPLFSIGAALVMISMMTIFTMNVMLPMFLQGALGAATFVSAILLLPATLTNGCMSLVSGKIYDKIGAKILLPAGYVILFFSVFLLSGATADTPLLVIMVIYIAVCVGIGCTLTSSQTSALNLLPREFYPHGVSIINTLQQIAAAIGSALFISIMSSTQQSALSNNVTPENAVAAGFHSSLWVMLIFIAAGFALSLTLSLARKKSATADCASR
jgi:DHA2 family lincomycin resistance protein-like MFS transporter